MNRCKCVCLLYLFLPILTLSGENLTPTIRLNGFMSQGFIKSWDNNFLTNTEASGTFDFNELGFSLAINLSPKLRLGFQLLSRDFGDVGNNRINLDWGFFDYRLHDSLGLRVGKVKIPFGLYNEGRDTDSLRSMVLLPQGMYDEHKRDNLVAYSGLGAYGTLFLNQMGDLEYDIYAGSINQQSDAVYLRFFTNLWNMTVMATKTGSPLMGINLDTKIIYGSRLIWNTPLVGLRLGGSLIMHQSTVNALYGSNGIGTIENMGWFILSAEYSIGPLQTTFEYSENPVDVIINNVNLWTDRSTQSWYVMASYQLGSVNLSALYDVYYTDKEDKEGRYYTVRRMPDYLGWRKDFGIGLRFDFSTNILAKLEWHSVDGGALFLSTYNNIPTMPRKWSYVASKISLRF